MSAKMVHGRPSIHGNKLNRRKSRLPRFRLDILPENLPIVAPYLWVKQHKKVVRHRDELKALIKPDKLLKDIYLYISGILHIPSMLIDTANAMKTITLSNGVLMYLVDRTSNRIYLCPNSPVNDDDADRVSWIIRTGSTIPAYVAETKESVIVNNMMNKEQFVAYDWKGMTITGVLCVPILISNGECYAVIELYRRSNVQYNIRDLNRIISICRLMGTAIDNNIERLHLNSKQSLDTYLLELTQFYFTNPDQLHDLVRDIVNLARDTLNSERGSFFLHDKNHNELLADVHQYNDVYGNLLHRRKLKIQANKERGIAELALKTGELINIRDAYNDPRFDRASDIKSGFITRSILAMPVMGREGVLGVLQLINKKQGYYTAVDEQIFQLFGDYCSIAIEHTGRHEKSIISQKWDEVYRDCYFSQILNISAFVENLFGYEETDLPKDFFEYSFYPTNDDKLIEYSLCLFNMLQFPQEHVLKFIFSVRRGYRNNHYHNFEHAFNVLHCVACTVQRNPEKFDRLEKVGMLISALCHDIDHRGVTNNYLEFIESPFVILYDESPLENHHYFLTQLILQESSIMERFSTAEFRIVKDYIGEMILSTDLTRHLQERSKIRLLCETISMAGEDIWMESIEHRRCVRNLIMTAADLSGQAKPFETAKKIVKKVMREFYEEGERMKQRGHTPLPFMNIVYIDRVPEFQIQFLDVVCIPCFELLHIILPNTYRLLELAGNLRATWTELIKVRDKQIKK